MYISVSCLFNTQTETVGSAILILRPKQGMKPTENQFRHMGWVFAQRGILTGRCQEISMFAVLLGGHNQSILATARHACADIPTIQNNQISILFYPINTHSDIPRKQNRGN